MKLSDIHIRDPFILPVADRAKYFLFGTTPASASGVGFDCYRSRNLVHWEGPIPAFRPPPGFWAVREYWAPEVHAFAGSFIMLATFSDGRRRRTQVLIAERPEGPFVPWSDGPVSPADWNCLDGTLHVDDSAIPWMVFCHEWTQIGDGAMLAMPLSSDLRQPAGPPRKLFSAARAPWARRLELNEAAQYRLDVSGPVLQRGLYVTDGPFLHRLVDGSLIMLWSSQGARGYAMGLARSTTCSITGTWTHDAEPLWPLDGGHGMLFRTLACVLVLALHQPNNTPHERTILQPVMEQAGVLRIREDAAGPPCL